jgi:hypothetical protein
MESLKKSRKRESLTLSTHADNSIPKSSKKFVRKSWKSFGNIGVLELCHKMSFWVSWQFKFCQNLRFVTIWVFELSQFEFFSFFTIWAFELCHNLSFWVVLQSEFCHSLSFVTIWVFELSQFEFLSLSKFEFLSFVTTCVFELSSLEFWNVVTTWYFEFGHKLSWLEF